MTETRSNLRIKRAATEKEAIFLYDLLIKNGTIVDGTGKKRYRADTAVQDGKIARIAPNITEPAKRTLDAEGLIVSPGFIDYHSHSDNAVLLVPDSYNYLEQGVTTQITGQCGSGPAPVYEDAAYHGQYGLSEEIWQKLLAARADFKSFMDYVSGLSFGTNYAFYIPHGNVRGKVMYYSPEKPNETQMSAMKALVRQAMECGYLGMTSGLVYAPSVYADVNELAELCKVVAEYQGSYASHIRGEGDKVVSSVAEALEVGRKANVPVIVSHLKVLGLHNKGKSAVIIKMIEDANAEGRIVRADQYPFLAGSAPFIAQIPPKFLTEGKEALLERLKDADFRQVVENSIFQDTEEFQSSIYEAGYDGCFMVSADVTPQYVGKNIGEIARAEGKQPIDVACDILIANAGDVQGIYFSQNNEDMMNIIAQPFVMGGSDWSDYIVHRDAEQVSGGHPRSTGTMTRRLELLRDYGLLTLEDAVHSITGLPAETSGLDGIGILQEGMRADITVFDYAGIQCNADFTYPFRKNDGIRYVVVGGALAVENGLATGVKNGTVLKKHKK